MADGVKKINEWILKEGRVIGITKDISASKFEGGTFYIHPNEGTLKYNNISKTGTKSWQKFLPTKIFDDLSIKRSLIDNNAINESKLEDGAVTTNKIKDDSITSAKLKKNSVTTEKITDLHVTTEKINNLAVTESKLRDSAVTRNKIKNSAINGDKIDQLSVNNNHIADGTIRNVKIYNKTIDNTKIADNTITTSLLKDDCITSAKIADDQVKSAHISQLNIETKHIKDRSITSNKIAQANINNEHFADNTINASKLVDGSIKQNKYSDLSIYGKKIADKTITMSKLDSSVQSLIEDAIRVEGTNNTATVKGNLKVNGNITATGNITGAKVFNPVFADIAEAYVPTEKLKVGQAVCLSLEGNLKVEPLSENNMHRFLGFVSDQYAACYGATPEQLENKELIAIALTGRIPVIIDTTNRYAKIGSYIGIEKGKVIPLPQYANVYCKPTSSIGRIIDIIDENTALVQV